jgi:ABC-2 type transport system permease protein
MTTRAVTPTPPSAALGSLRLVARQVYYEQLAFWLNPVGAFFTVGFALLFLVLLSASAGNSRISYLHNIKLVQYYVPGFIAYGAMSAAFTNLAISIVIRRESGLLKRLRLSPLPTWALLAAIMLSTLIVTFVEVALMLVVGDLAFGVHLPSPASSIVALVVVLVLGALAFGALGTAMSTVIPNQQAAGPVTSTVFFVLLFLSGLWFPLKAHSTLAQISSWFPIRHFLNAVFQTFIHPGTSAWAWHDMLVVAIWGAIGGLIALRRFKLAPHRA